MVKAAAQVSGNPAEKSPTCSQQRRRLPPSEPPMLKSPGPVLDLSLHDEQLLSIAGL